MANVHYSALAAADIYENAEYIARDKPDAALRWIESIEAVCELLAHNPAMGQQRTLRHHGRCRSFVSGNYVIFFRTASDGVEIVRVIRGERDIENL